MHIFWSKWCQVSPNMLTLHNFHMIILLKQHSIFDLFTFIGSSIFNIRLYLLTWLFELKTNHDLKHPLFTFTDGSLFCVNLLITCWDIVSVCITVSPPPFANYCDNSQNYDDRWHYEHTEINFRWVIIFSKITRPNRLIDKIASNKA